MAKFTITSIKLPLIKILKNWRYFVSPLFGELGHA